MCFLTRRLFSCGCFKVGQMQCIDAITYNVNSEYCPRLCYESEVQHICCPEHGGPYGNCRITWKESRKHPEGDWQAKFKEKEMRHVSKEEGRRPIWKGEERRFVFKEEDMLPPIEKKGQKPEQEQKAKFNMREWDWKS